MTLESVAAGACGGQVHVGEVADSGFDRAVDVADDAGGAAHRAHLHRLVEAAGLGRVDRDDLRGVLFDDLDHVVRVPGGLVGHDRRDRWRGRLARSARSPSPAVRRRSGRPIPSRGWFGWPARRLVAFVGIDTELDLRSGRFADGPTIATSRAGSTPILILMVRMPSAATLRTSDTASSISRRPIECVTATFSRSRPPSSIVHGQAQRLAASGRR